MTWILATLLNNKHALKRAQEETDLHVGRDRRVEASGIKNLVYLQAIAKETLRLYPPWATIVTLRGKRRLLYSRLLCTKRDPCVCQCVELHRDPSIWSQPEKFSPESFITGNGELDEGHHFEYFPFGLGRRACPRSTLATRVNLMTLANLIQGFDLDVPKNEPVDMGEGFGLTSSKLTTLQILLTPQAPYELYH